MQNASSRFLKALFIWGIGCFFYFYQFIGRIIPSITSEQLMHDLNLSASAFAVSSSSWYIAYAIAQLPLGLLLDVYNPKRVMSLSCLIIALGSYVVAVSHSYHVLALGRVLMGIGSSGALISTMKISRLLFSPAMFPVASSTTIAIGVLAPIFCNLFASDTIAIIGWRMSFLYTAILGIVLSFIMALFVQTPASDNEKKSAMCGKVLKNPELIAIGVIALILYSIVSAIGDMWGATFFTVVFDISPMSGQFVNIMIYIGYSIGCFLIGWIVNKIDSIYLVHFISSAAIAVILGCLSFCSFDIDLVSASLLMFFIGILASSKVLTFTQSVLIADKSSTGTAIALVNCMTMLGGTLCQSGIGIIMDMTWNGAVSENGRRIYAVKDYKAGLSFIFLLFILSACLSLYFLKKNNRNRKVS
ncbi:Putative MFS transporter [Candidatus Fokinia solitaria]|uniref:MFS transporter n=1 Tax=Candidatus Fokinia solitaria TaxID=1802984 RepID=A0A2U8BR79_9RICK|nr:MFS transporter [Candidatus Fokinia solitaria]AWD32845.1 Putative MFS transporter [Candidatus Fokinia solitaria]